MGNIFSQQGLGSMLQLQLSQREKDALNRQLIQAQIEEQRQKAAQYSNPNYLRSQQPSAVQEFQYYQGLSPEQQVEYRRVKRASPEDILKAKGIDYDPITGQADNVHGYPDARAREQSAITKARGLATTQATKQSELTERVSMLPELEQTITELNALGEKATYTKAGQVADVVRKELGLPEDEKALARTAYMAMVDNQVLPLLRQTFGSQFTAAEGERLRQTLGDPNKSPPAKKFVLDAFIKQKKRDIQSLKRELGASKDFYNNDIPTDNGFTDSGNGYPIAPDMGGEQVIMPNEVQPVTPKRKVYNRNTGKIE